MASDPQLERRVSRLENDTTAIYELITEIRSTQQEHSRHFEKVDGRLDKIDGRLDKIDGRLDKMDGRLDKMDGRLDKVDGRLDNIAATMAEVVRRLPDSS